MIDTSRAMMPITISSSTSENPRRVPASRLAVHASGLIVERWFIRIPTTAVRPYRSVPLLKVVTAYYVADDPKVHFKTKEMFLAETAASQECENCPVAAERMVILE